MFRDRTEAGRLLANRLRSYRQDRPVVLGLPRGGVPVAAQVAKVLRAPLDVIVVRKLGVPMHPELAMGAVGEGGTRVLNDVVIRGARVAPEALARVEEAERRIIDERVRTIRQHAPRLDISGRVVIVVDDGLATGATARAAVEVARAHGAAKVIIAAPVGAPDTVARLAEVADDIVTAITPRRFDAVGQWYEDFRPVSETAVIDLLVAGRRVPDELGAP